jgi:ATP-dependent Clp protease protease subunit
MTSNIGWFIVIIVASCGFAFGALRIFGRSGSSEKDADLKRRIVRITGPIDDPSANDVIARLLYLDKASTTEPIRLIIHSPGGAVLAGLAIIDTIELIKAPVFTRCAGNIGSMALVIVTCGHQGRRSVATDAQVLFSMPEAPVGASREQQGNAERLAVVLIEKVSKASGLPKEYVRRLFEERTPIDAPRAIGLGLVDTNN